MNLKDIEKQIPIPEWLNTLPTESKLCVFGGSVRDLFINKPSRDNDYNTCNITEKDLINAGFVNQNHQTCKLFTNKKYPDDEVMLINNFDKELTELDLTVHCVGYEFKTKSWLDPTEKGLNDLQNKILRMPNTDMVLTPNYDANRVLRLMRLSLTLAEYGFTIDEKTQEKAIWLANQLGFKSIDKKRVIKQLKLIKENHSNEFKKLLKDWGLTNLVNEVSDDENKSKKNKLKIK